MSNVNAVLDFIAKVVMMTVSQLAWLLGLIFVFGLLMFLCARFTRNTYIKACGGDLGTKLDIIVTGWIGTPVHEIGHAVFCYLFGHRVHEVVLYSPNSEDGTLGYVSHSHNENSRFQQIGNFFIGIGPILFGSVALYALMYYLMPGMLSMFATIEEQGVTLAQDITSGNWTKLFTAFLSSLSGIWGAIFDASNIFNWKFWVFLYFSFCIASHMELSPPDIKGALSGLITFVLSVLLLNLLVSGIEVFGFEKFAGDYWKYVKIETYAPHINAFLGALGALLSYALVISALNFILTFCVLSIYSFRTGNGFFNPFWFSR